MSIHDKMNQAMEERLQQIKEKREEEKLKIKIRFYLTLFIFIVAILLNIFVKSWNIYHTLIVVYWLEFSNLKNEIRDLKEKLSKKV